MEQNKERLKAYTLLSAFEPFLRQFIGELYRSLYGNKWIEKIPAGIRDSVNEKINEREKNTVLPNENIFDFLEETDLPHLKELLITGDVFKHAQSLCGVLNKEDFITTMDTIYRLRNKIAHMKRNFSSFDVSLLLDSIKNVTSGKDGTSFLHELPDLLYSETITEIPSNFFIDKKTKCKNNLPHTDYDLDGGFIGRRKDIKTIKKMTYSDLDRIITICGAGGVGKTALAQEVAYEILDDLENPFNAIIWVSAKKSKLSPTGIETIDDNILRNYENLLGVIVEVLVADIDKIENYRTEYLEESVKTLLSTEKCLLIIDNLETIEDERIINFIKDVPRPNKVIITSRRGLGEIERRYPLKELEDSEASILFRLIAKEKRLEKLSNTSEEIIKRYTRQVQNYPLAIKWCIGQIALGKDVEKVFRTVTAPESKLIEFCFSDTFSYLDENAKKILFGISMFESNSPPTKAILAHIVNLNLEVFEEGIEKLIVSSLIIPEQEEVPETKRLETTYSILSLTREFILVRLDEKKELKADLFARRCDLEKHVEEAEKTKQQHAHSLWAMGAKTDSEKISLLKSQTAWNLYQNGKYDEALKLIEEAKRIAPYFASVYRNHAVIEAEEKHAEAADQLMKKATDLDPKTAHLWYVWGNIDKKLHRTENAYKHYKQALSLTPKDPLILSAYAICQSHRGQFQDAEECFKKALESKKDSPRHQIINRQGLAENSRRWSEILVKEKNYDLAISKLTEASLQIETALKFDPMDFKLQDTKNNILISTGIQIAEREGIDKAEPIFKNCLETGHPHIRIARYKSKEIIATAHYYLAYYTQKAQKPEEVWLQYAKKGLQTAPPGSYIYDKLKHVMEYKKIKRGNIAHFNWIKKFGFIKCEDGNDYFFHITSVNTFLDLETQQQLKDRFVSFEAAAEGGKNIAKNITLL